MECVGGFRDTYRRKKQIRRLIQAHGVVTTNAPYIVRHVVVVPHHAQCTGGAVVSCPHTHGDLRRGADAHNGRRCGPAFLNWPRLVCPHAQYTSRAQHVLFRWLGDERCAVHKSPPDERARLSLSRPLAIIHHITRQIPIYTSMDCPLMNILPRSQMLAWTGRRETHSFRLTIPHHKV
jgi:hypothetical protein